jgi:polysaccharide biosynthesis transport protein
VPHTPAFPRKSLMIGLGLFGSFGVGIFLALVRGMMSEGIRNASELQTAFGLTPLAAIPLVEPSGIRAVRRADTVTPRAVPTKLTRLVADNGTAETRRLAELIVKEPNSPFSESIHSLRFALRQATHERQMSIILVTSALPAEGKSTVTANLARAAAMYGERVLLIDADLRRPSVAGLFGLPPSPGLVSLVKGKCGLKDAVLRDVHTELHLIAGVNRVTGSEALTLLASRELGRLMNDLRPLYDLILIDSSPLLPVADPRFLVNQVDGVALIVASEQTSRSAVKAALQETPGIEAKILGAVMNRVQDDYARSYPEYGSFHKVA